MAANPLDAPPGAAQMLIATLLLTIAGIITQSPIPLLLGVLAALEWRHAVCMQETNHAGF